MDFKHTVTDKKEYALIAIKGSLIEKHQADELMTDLDNLFLHDKNKIVIDLSELNFINQTGAEILFRILAVSRRNGGEVTTCSLNEELKKIEEGKKIQHVFVPSENEFIAAALL